MSHKTKGYGVESAVEGIKRKVEWCEPPTGLRRTKDTTGGGNMRDAGSAKYLHQNQGHEADGRATCSSIPRELMRLSITDSPTHSGLLKTSVQTGQDEFPFGQSVSTSQDRGIPS